MKNYYKATMGSVANMTARQEFFFFNDLDAEEARSSLQDAREMFGSRGNVSVWRRALTVPSHVREIGEVPPDADVLQPGQATATRKHSTPLVPDEQETVEAE